MTNPHLSSRNSFMSQAAARGRLHHWLGTTEGLKDTGACQNEEVTHRPGSLAE